MVTQDTLTYKTGQKVIYQNDVYTVLKYVTETNHYVLTKQLTCIAPANKLTLLSDKTIHKL